MSKFIKYKNQYINIYLLTFQIIIKDKNAYCIKNNILQYI